MTVEALGAKATEPLWRIRVRLFWRSVWTNWGLFAQNKIGLFGLAIIVMFGLMVLAHPILMNTVWDPRTYDPVVGHAFDEAINPAAPSGTHLLGTDPFGRDILSQLMYSARAEFALGLTAAIFTVVLGTAVGAVAAYFGGVVDGFLMRLADIVVMMPALSLLIVLGALFNLNEFWLAFAVGAISGLGATGIIIKSQALSLTVKPYVEAARVAGGSHFHIIMVHIVPNLLPLAFLYMMFTVTAAIFSEAVLSFFGILNIRMSWGLMIHVAQTQGYLLGRTDFWWLVIPAGLAITFLCGSFYLVGRALDEVVNPKLRKR